jgi:uncharacterized sulfatase
MLPKKALPKPGKVWQWYMAPACALVFLGLIAAIQPDRQLPPPRPNILLIFVDDMGWSAISANQPGIVPTPNIDRLARGGMRFTDGYATPQCTPSRAALLTGQHTARNGMWHVIPGYSFPYQGLTEPEYVQNLGFEAFTLAEALKTAGYVTGIRGKWHLNTYGEVGYYTRLFEKHAAEYGFDSVDPLTDPAEYQGKTDKGVQFLTDQAIDFLRTHRDTSFFLYLSHHTIHGPVLAPDSLVEKYRRLGYPETGLNHVRYLAALEHFDRETGRLLDSLDRFGLAQNTLVVFTSDNGGVDSEFSSAPFRYGKGTLYEGGVRVPWIIRWPEKVAAGSVCTAPVHLMDLYPTFAAVAGVKVPQKQVLDGKNLLPLLTGKGKFRREAIFGYAPLYDRLWYTTPGASVRKGRYKLIRFFGDYVDRESGNVYLPGERLELYDLVSDPGERNNLSQSEPARLKELSGDLNRWLNEMNAGLPVPNPVFNPDSVWVRK